jgi:hypothetical protein
MNSNNRDARASIVRAARGILDGTLHPLEGCRVIARAHHRLPEELTSDAAIVTIVGIESETDHFPLGEVRGGWDSSALKRKDEEVEAYLARVGASISAACREIVLRLG